MPSTRSATDRQVRFISDLLDRKNLFASPKFFDQVGAMDFDEYQDYVAHLKQQVRAVPVARASAIIDALLALPNEDEDEDQAPQRGLPDVPAGHYAITAKDGTHTVFYRVDRPTSGRWAGRTFVKLQLSDSYERVRYDHVAGILSRIREDGIESAMRRYGLELGRCGRCNRTLTNELSRQLGIGPVCRGEMGWS